MLTLLPIISQMVLSVDGIKFFGIKVLLLTFFLPKSFINGGIISPKFSKTLRNDFDSSCWSSITFSFNSLFSIQKFWIVSFKLSDEGFEVGAFNLTMLMILLIICWKLSLPRKCRNYHIFTKFYIFVRF